MKKTVIRIVAVFAFLLQVVLLIYSLINFKGGVEENVHFTFLRITLLIGSAVMVIMTRYFLRFISIMKSSKSTLFVQIISLLPAIVIPAGGFVFAYRMRSGSEYILFFVIGLYHLVRYYPLLERI
ncbi:MAG: hypothetical protein QMD82_03240 [bacterium]|nr:hypothetical protein [bacterium]